MEEVSKHLEDKDSESSHLWGRRGKCGHGSTPDLGSGGVDSRDEQAGWTPSPHSLPAPCSTVGKQLGFCCDSHGATEGFKLMIVLVRFAFEKELPGTGLGS